MLVMVIEHGSQIDVTNCVPSAGVVSVSFEDAFDEELRGEVGDLGPASERRDNDRGNDRGDRGDRGGDRNRNRRRHR